MRVEHLNHQCEPAFWKHVYNDIPNYYFFILDMEVDSSSTNILLALNSRNRIEGLMMVYKEKYVQLRGSLPALEALLPRLQLRKAEIQIAKEYNHFILERLWNPKCIHEITLMTLRKGEEKSDAVHRFEKLSVEDAEEIAALMRRGDPEWWGDVNAVKIAEGIRDRLWYGIRVNETLVSVGGATIKTWGSNIATVVTHEAHRSKGYATSIVSALIDTILLKASLVLIHVEKGNTPAYRVYSKVGFKPYREYLVIRT